MRKSVHAVDDKLDVGAGFALAGKRRAVDDLKGAADEIGPELLILDRVEIADAFEHAPAHPVAVHHAKRMPFKPAQPALGVGGKGAGKGRILFKQARIYIVEVDKQRAVYFVKVVKAGHTQAPLRYP